MNENNELVQTIPTDLTKYTDIELGKELIRRGWTVQIIGIGIVLVEPRGAGHPKEQSCEK